MEFFRAFSCSWALVCCLVAGHVRKYAWSAIACVQECEHKASWVLVCCLVAGHVRTYAWSAIACVQECEHKASAHCVFLVIIQ